MSGAYFNFMSLPDKLANDSDLFPCLIEARFTVEQTEVVQKVTANSTSHANVCLNGSGLLQKLSIYQGCVNCFRTDMIILQRYLLLSIL